MKRLTLSLLTLFVLFLAPACSSSQTDHGHDDHDDHGHDDHDDHGHDDHDHDDHGHDDHGHDDEIHFPAEYQGKVGFRADEVQRRSLQPSIPLYATLQPASDAAVTVRAPFDGQIQAPPGGIPELGQAVQKGQVLAYLTPRQDPGQRASLQAELEEAQVELARAERDLARITTLVAEQALPERRLADAESDLNLARARHERARQSLGHLSLRAPIDGVITERTLTTGSFVTTGSPLLHLLTPGRLHLHVSLPEIDLTKVDPTAGGWIRLPDDTILPLRPDDLLATGPRIDPHSRTATFIFALAHDHQALLSLRPGTTLTAHLHTGPAREVLAIPRSAVLEEEGLPVVFEVHGRESFHRRVIQTGPFDATHIEVLQGLQEGDFVVSRGTYFVRLAAAATGDIGHGHAH